MKELPSFIRDRDSNVIYPYAALTWLVSMSTVKLCLKDITVNHNTVCGNGGTTIIHRVTSKSFYSIVFDSIVQCPSLAIVLGIGKYKVTFLQPLEPSLTVAIVPEMIV